MKAPTSFTEHALDRYIERWCPGTKRHEARQVLRFIAVVAAVHVEDLPDEGQEIWRGPGAFREVLMVVRDGEVTTVLPKGAKRPETRR